MAIVLEAVAADGGVQRLPMSAAGQTAIGVERGYTYRLVDDTGVRVAVSPQVARIGNDLVVEGLNEGRSVVLEGFFTRCGADGCALSLENLGATGAETIIPASEPIAALSDGNFLMYSPGASSSPSLAAPESAFDFKPVLGVAGGLAIVGGAGGGGGDGGSSDSTPPAAPIVTSSAFTTRTSPVFTGTGEPGAKITMTLFGTGVVTYETTVAGDGSWRIDTDADQPVRGTSFELIEGVPVPYSAIASDAAGNPSPIVAGTVTLDSVALGAPTITSPLLTHDTTPVIAGMAEPGAQVTVGLDFDRDATIDATWVTTAQASGEWAVDLESAPASGIFPGGQLANLSRTGIVVTAVDDAGNTTPATTAVLEVNTSLPTAPTIETVAGDNRVNALEADVPITIRGTLPEADRPVTVTWGGTSVAATVSGTSWSVVFPSAPADGTSTVFASYVSGDGVTSAQAARPVAIDRVAPGAPAISSVPENDGGGIGAGEASDGTIVRVALGGTGAAAGDRIVLSWDGATVMHTITGTEIGGNVASVNVSASTIASQGDGVVDIVARIIDLAGNEGAQSAAFPVTVDRSPPGATAAITAALDNAGPVTGDLSNGATTDDTSPTLVGSVSSLSSGDRIEVLRNGNAIGFATVSGDGWSFADSGLSDDASYAWSARVVDAVGNRGAAGNTFRLTIETDSPDPSATLTDAEIRDDVSPRRGRVDDGEITNDRTPTLRLTFDDMLDAGVGLRIYRATGSGPAIAIGFAEHDRNTTWEFTDGPLAGLLARYTYTAELVDAGGHSTPLPLDYTIFVI